MPCNCQIISVVRDFAMYKRCIQNNPFVSNCHLTPLDNRTLNRHIGECYNDFLDSFNYENPAWLIFCHEDFEFKESLSEKLCALNPLSAIYGPIGAVTKPHLGLYYKWQLKGAISESTKTGNDVQIVGRPPSAADSDCVDTLDCQCLITHSSLIKKSNLRFDTHLSFDLYVEDFCIAAMEQHNIPSIIINIKCQHWSKGTIVDRYEKQLQYLREKWPTAAYTGTAAQLIGGGGSWAWKTQVKFKRTIQKVIRSLSGGRNT